MPHDPSQISSLRRHKPSQLGVVTLNGHDHYLGHWAENQKMAPAGIRDAIVANGLRSPRPTPMSVAELILQFWERYATVYYRHLDGSPTSEQDNFKLSLRPLRRLFGNIPAAELSPLKLKAVRQLLIDTGVSRGVINQRVGRVKRLFKWGVAEKLVP